jgi:exportin-1
MFYEAVGNMIAKDPDFKRQTFLIQNMMQPTYIDWAHIFDQANSNPGILQNNMIIKAIDIIVKINEKVAISVKTPYWSFASFIFENIINSYMFYSNSINEAYNKQQYTHEFKLLKSIKKTILRYLTTMINNIDSQEIIMNYILPQLSNLIESYRYSHIDNRDADVLLVFSAVLEKLKNTQYDYIVSIWNFLCLFTLDMIKSDFQSYPEHRMNFFTLLKSLISNAFDGKMIF